jgi:tetratricopeptide (TPR) repeat protein
MIINRKRHHPFLEVLALCLIALPFTAGAREPAGLAGIDQQISDLAGHLDRYPAHIASRKELKQVQSRLDEALKLVNRLAAKEPGNAQIKWRLGELYRMAHNIDRPGAWENSERHLKEAIKLDPKGYGAWLSLGRLYAGTNLDYAKRAELCFISAQKLYGDKVLTEAHRGLFFVYYYQGRMQEAVREADIVLSVLPDDPAMPGLREIAKALDN